MAQLYQCPRCMRRTFTLVKFIQHVGLVHAHEPSFSITCGISECQSTFSQFQSFRKHVYRKHRCLVSRSLNTEAHPEDANVEQQNVFLHQQNSEVDPSAANSQIVEPNLDRLLEDFQSPEMVSFPIATFYNGTPCSSR